MDYKFRNMYCFNNAIRHFLKMDKLLFPEIEIENDDQLTNIVYWSTPFPVYIKKDYESNDFRKLKMPNILNYKICLDYYSKLDKFYEISKIGEKSRLKVNYDSGTFKEKTYEYDVDNDLSLLCTKDYLIRMDIKSFYDGIYLHNLEIKDSLLGTLNDGCTNGLILGNYLSLFFAERYLSHIARKLEIRFNQDSIDCDFSYFSDDFFFFVNSKDVEKVKLIFSDVLSEFDLHINDSKTRKLTYLEYNNDNILNRYWNKIVSNQNNHIYEWYNRCIQNGEKGDNITYLYTVFNQLIYRCYQLSNNKKQNVLVNSFFKSYYWNEEQTCYKFRMTSSDIHQVIYLVKEYPESILYLIPKLDLSFNKTKEKFIDLIRKLFVSSLDTKYHERQLYYCYTLLYLNSNIIFDDLFSLILGTDNQILISILLINNGNFNKSFTCKGITKRLVDSPRFWFVNYHIILSYYCLGKTGKEQTLKYIDRYLIPIKYKHEPRKLMKEFYYNNIVEKNAFVSSVSDINDSIIDYLKKRNHINNENDL